MRPAFFENRKRKSGGPREEGAAAFFMPAVREEEDRIEQSGAPVWRDIRSAASGRRWMPPLLQHRIGQGGGGPGLRCIAVLNCGDAREEEGAAANFRCPREEERAI